MKKTAQLAIVTVAIAAFPASWSLAAGTSDGQNQNATPNEVNTGLKTRNPATNAAGVNGMAGNKSGQSVNPDDSSASGISSGELGAQQNSGSSHENK